MLSGVKEYGTERYGGGRFGLASLIWTRRMLASYESLHGALDAALRTELFQRLRPGGYPYQTFGPPGQKKTVCDFVMAFNITGNVGGRYWSKSGDVLRWNFNGTIYWQNSLPTYTKGSGVEICTVSATDGWSGVSIITANSVYLSGNYIDLHAIGFTGLLSLDIQNSHMFSRNSTKIALLTSLTAYKVYGLIGDVSDFVVLSNLTTLWIRYGGGLTMSGTFVSAILTSLSFYHEALSQVQVDFVFSDYITVHGSTPLDANLNYNIDLNYTAIPSLAGFQDYITLMELYNKWTDGAGSMTIILIYPTDLVSGWNFTDGWIAHEGGTIDDADSFHSDADGGGIKKVLLTVGKNYLLKIAGTVSANNLIVRSAAGTVYRTLTGSFDDEFIFTAADDVDLYLKATGNNATVDITNLKLYLLD